MPRVRRLAPGALLLLAVAAYANAYAGVFLFDDRAVILDDPRLASPSAFFASAAETIRPFTKLTFLVDRQLYGERPAGYHLLNTLLHLASGLLAYAVALRLGAGNGVAWWTAALFLLHPLATEAVTYISGRPTGLMACCYLAAFLLFLKAREDQLTAWRWRRTAIFAAGCLALSLLAKETAVVFPVLLGCYEVVARGARRGQPRNDSPRQSRAVWLHLTLGGTVAVFLGGATLHARYAYLFEYGLGLRGIGENLATQAVAVVYALTLFMRPTHLNFDHDLTTFASFTEPAPLFAAAVIALLLFAAALAARRLPLVAFGIAWFFIHLLPTNSVLPRYDILSERNLYLPSFGIYLAAVSAAAAAWRQAEARFGSPHAPAGYAVALRKGSALMAGALLLATLTAATASRNHLYADPVRFWSDAVRKSPDKARPHTNLGHAWFEAGQIDRALDEFRRALALDPYDPVAQRNLLEAWKVMAGVKR